MSVKTKALGFCLLAVAAGSLAGCTATASSSPTSSSHQRMTTGMLMQDDSTMGAMVPGMVMPNGSTMAPGSPDTAPSKATKMICTDETREDITTVLSITPDPKPAST